MSDLEANDHGVNQENDEVDDLFGEDEEEQQTETQMENGEDNEDEDDADGNDDDKEEQELKTLDIALPRHAVAHKPEEDTYTLKMPVFLNVEAHPFDPTEFKEKVGQSAFERKNSSMNAKQVQNDLNAEKLLNENTIRWRYTNSGNDEIIKQSNAHFVQWNDGSISLKIGSEMFDYKELPVYDNFLVKTHDDYEILQNDSIINKLVNLLPSSAFTSTHKKLTEAVKNIQKKDKILNTITDNDPLLKQRMADENEKKSLKMKRQMEMKRRLQEERLERTNSPVPGMRNSYEPAYERFERTYGDEEYDEEDDFIANDEEEEEEGFDDDEEEEEFEKGSERLKKLKDEGASKYSNRDETEEELQNNEQATHQREEEEEEEEEDNKQARKKRRIIDSDDEE